LKETISAPATLEILEGERSRVVGSLDFSTVANLLRIGDAAIWAGHAATIDLSGVSDSDSSGLALLVEWLSVAKSAQRTLRYENIPAQLIQLARLSDVEELLTAA
jgi:phospholipid transport system transporter-binding protein